MGRYDQRLRRLARTFGCPRHGGWPSCDTCDHPTPVPEHLLIAQRALIDTIFARVGIEAMRTAHHQIPPMPLQRQCKGCGGRRTCMDCGEFYAREMLRRIGLTPDERARWEALLAEARAMDRASGRWRGKPDKLYNTRARGRRVSPHGET